MTLDIGFELRLFTAFLSQVIISRPIILNTYYALFLDDI